MSVSKAQRSITTAMAGSFVIVLLAEQNLDFSDVDKLGRAAVALIALWLIFAMLADTGVGKVVGPLAWLTFFAILLARGIDAFSNITAGMRRKQIKDRNKKGKNNAG
jgi:hypothetical protein